MGIVWVVGVISLGGGGESLGTLRVRREMGAGWERLVRIVGSLGMVL